MGTTKDITIRLIGDTKQFTKSMDNVANKLKVTGDKFTSFGRGAAIRFTALSVGIIGLTKTFAGLEKGIVNTLTLLDDQQVAQFGETIKNEVTGAVSQMGFAIDDANKAMFDTVSALGAGDKAFKTFAVAQRLAVGGVTDLGVAADGLTSIMNAYGKETTKANDVAVAFFTAQKFGKTTVAALASNIGKVAPIAKSAGIGFQELLAATSQLTLGGLSTEEATTALKGAISGLVKPSEGAAKVLKKFGVPMGATEIRAKGFTFTLRKLAEAAKENPDAVAEMIPNIRALTAVSALGEEELSNMEMIMQSIGEESIKSAQGLDVLTSAVDKQQATADFAFKKMAGSFTIAAAAIGEALAPALITLSGVLTSITDKISNLSPGMKRLIAGILLTITGLTGLVAAFGLIGGQLLTGISLIIKISKFLKAFNIIQGITNVLLALNPFVWIVIGVVAAIAAIVLLIKNWSKIVKFFKDSFKKLIKFWAGFAKGIKRKVIAIGRILVKLGAIMGNVFRGKFKEAKEGWADLKKEFKKPVKIAAPQLKTKGGKSIEAGSAGDAKDDKKGLDLANSLGKTTSTGAEAGEVTGQAFTSAFVQAVQAGEDVFLSLGNQLQTTIVTGILESFFDPIGIALEELAMTIISSFNETFSFALDPIKNFAKTGIKIVGDFFKEILFKNNILVVLMKFAWEGFQKFWGLLFSGAGLLRPFADFLINLINPMKLAQVAMLTVAKVGTIAWALIMAIPTLGASLAAIPVALAEWAAGAGAIMGVGFQQGSPGIEEDMIAQFGKNEIVVPETFSEGIKGGDLALVGAGATPGGGPQIINNFNFEGATLGSPSDDFITAIEDSIFERGKLEIGGID